MSNIFFMSWLVICKYVEKYLFKTWPAFEFIFKLLYIFCIEDPYYIYDLQIFLIIESFILSMVVSFSCSHLHHFGEVQFICLLFFFPSFSYVAFGKGSVSYLSQHNNEDLYLFLSKSFIGFTPTFRCLCI